MKSIAKKLIEAGWDEKKAKIYLAVLGLGRATVTDVAKRAGIKRTTTYQHLEDIEREGLISITIIGKRKVYLAENPKKILGLIEKKKRILEKSMPELNMIFSTASYRPSIKIYEGVDGLRSVYSEITKTSKTVYSAFSADRYYGVFSKKDGEEFFENIKNQGGQIKDVVENTKIGRLYVKAGYHKDFGSAKLLPKNFKLSVDVLVAGDKVAMISFGNLTGILIENKEIAEVQRNFIKFMRKGNFSKVV